MMTLRSFWGSSILIAVLAFSFWQLAGTRNTTAATSSCSGSHCTIVANYLSFFGLHTVMSMDTHALPFGLATPRSCQSGDTFTVPVDAGGEIVGHAIGYYDSPPIVFQEGGRVVATTLGLAVFGIRILLQEEFLAGGQNENLDPGGIAGQEPDRAKTLVLQGTTRTYQIGDVVGKWHDSWQGAINNAASGAITCTTAFNGRTATCQINETLNGQSVRLTLSRTVEQLRVAPLPALSWPIATYISHFQNGRAIQATLPTSTSHIPPVNGDVPASTMTSSVVVNCLPAPSPSLSPSPSPSPSPAITVSPSPRPECSDAIDNEDPEDSLIDVADPGCHTDGNADNPASYDPSDNDERNSLLTSPSPTPSASPVPTVTFPFIREIE